MIRYPAWLWRWGKVGAGLLLLSTGGSVGTGDTRNINISHYTPVSSADIHTDDRRKKGQELLIKRLKRG